MTSYDAKLIEDIAKMFDDLAMKAQKRADDAGKNKIHSTQRIETRESVTWNAAANILRETKIEN